MLFCLPVSNCIYPVATQKFCHSEPKSYKHSSVLQVNEGKPIEVLSEPVREAIMKNVRRRMTPQPVKIRADVELTCFAYDGVLALQVPTLALRQTLYE